MTSRAERGSASVWVLAVAALVLALAGAIAVRSSAVLARHRAEAAADLAALAAATRIGADAPVQICAAARSVAQANGAELTRCAVRLGPSGRAGIVWIEVSRTVNLPWLGRRPIHAHARAERAPP